MSTPVRPLAPRYLQVAALMRRGLRAREIAAELGLTVNTAGHYISVVQRHDKAVAAAAAGDRPPLTARERQIANLIEVGATDRDIAQRLGINLRTVEAHVSNVLHKFGQSDRSSLVQELAPSTGIGALSFRELEVLHLVARGLSQEAIARRLNVSLRTVESHVQSIRKKLEVPGYRSLARYGVKAPRHSRS